MNEHILKTKLLIVGPAFFNYLDAIQTEFKKIGIETRVEIERGKETTFSKVVYRSCLLKYIFSHVIKKRHKDIINASIAFGATHILFISPESMSKKLLIRLKENNVRTLLYMWDSFDNKNAARKFLRFFDRSSTFDPVDSNKFNMNLINLFAEDIFFSKENSIREYDFVFVGTAHSIRPRIILKLNSIFANTNFKNKIHLYRGNIFYYILGLLKTNFRDPNIFTKKSISKENVAKYFKNSKFVLDITHPKQQGLTSRSFEALASGAFLVTNNKRALDLIPSFKEKIILYDDIKDLKYTDLNFISKDLSEERTYSLSIRRFCNDLKILIDSCR